MRPSWQKYFSFFCSHFLINSLKWGSFSWACLKSWNLTPGDSFWMTNRNLSTLEVPSKAGMDEGGLKYESGGQYMLDNAVELRLCSSNTDANPLPISSFLSLSSLTFFWIIALMDRVLGLKILRGQHWFIPFGSMVISSVESEPCSPFIDMLSWSFRYKKSEVGGRIEVGCVGGRGEEAGEGWLEDRRARGSSFASFSSSCWCSSFSCSSLWSNAWGWCKDPVESTLICPSVSMYTLSTGNCSNSSGLKEVT